jgi:hypothetical protein
MWSVVQSEVSLFNKLPGTASTLPFSAVAAAVQGAHSAAWHSPYSPYSEALVSFDSASAKYNPQKVRGYIDIQAVEQQAQMWQRRSLDKTEES